jgi:hypothetical protein
VLVVVPERDPAGEGRELGLPCPAPGPAVITDEELLAACRSAGEPGTESHRRACRLYRRSVIEWQSGDAGWRAECMVRDAVSQLAAVLARGMESEALESARRRPQAARCGTSGGWKRHRREGTPTCPACREYERERTRARTRSAVPEGQEWAAAA